MQIHGYANRGRFLEEAITWANRRYLAQGRALVHKVPTAFLPLRGRPGPDGKRPLVGAKVDEKAAVDFLGVRLETPRGLALAFDAKECAGPRWFLKELQPHQAEFLEYWSRSGAAFILLFFKTSPAGSLYLVTWEELRQRIEARKNGKGMASIAEEELAATRPAIRAGRGVAFEYLAEVDRLWN